VVTLDEHYPTRDWAPIQDVLLMIATNQTVKKRQKKREEGEDVYEFTCKTFYHQTEDEIRADFASTTHRSLRDVDESMRNTLYAASRTTPFLVDRTREDAAGLFPGDDNVRHLRKLVAEGLKRRGYGARRGVRQADRIRDRDLRSITTSSTTCSWSGRSSSGRSPIVRCPSASKGELVYEGPRSRSWWAPAEARRRRRTVSWAIGITNINPIKSPPALRALPQSGPQGVAGHRSRLPARSRRRGRGLHQGAGYGKDNVVDIIAHSTFGPRAALTDVGRVLSIPYDHVKAVTKTIDDTERAPLDEIRLVNPRSIAGLVSIRTMWATAVRMIQGQVARKSEHAGGVLLLPGQALETTSPLSAQGGQKGKLLSAFGERSGKGNAAHLRLRLRQDRHPARR
jgi:hypothetical protein